MLPRRCGKCKKNHYSWGHLRRLTWRKYLACGLNWLISFGPLQCPSTVDCTSNVTVTMFTNPEKGKTLYIPRRDCIVAIIITTLVVKLMGRGTNYRHLARGNSLRFYYSPLLATNFPLPTHINPAWQAIRIKVSIRSWSPVHRQRCVQQSAVQLVGAVTCREVAYSSWSLGFSLEITLRPAVRTVGFLDKSHLEQE